MYSSIAPILLNIIAFVVIIDTVCYYLRHDTKNSCDKEKCKEEEKKPIFKSKTSRINLRTFYSVLC